MKVSLMAFFTGFTNMFEYYNEIFFYLTLEMQRKKASPLITLREEVELMTVR